ncbi:glycosyltransferase [Myroides sp. LJL115]
MRVLQVINSLHFGGAEKLVTDIVPIMSSKNVKVDVAVLNNESTSFYQDLLNSNSCNVFGLGEKYYSISYFFKLYKLAKNYDVIHVHLFPSQYYLAFLKLFSMINVKLVFTEHSTSNRRLQNKYFRYFEKIIYKQYSSVICITEQVKDALRISKVIDMENLAIVDNGVNVMKISEKIAYSRSEYGYGKDDVLLVMVAGFRREKDQDTVVRALSLLDDKYKLIFIGEGERLSIVENLVCSLSMEKRVSFLGGRSDIYNILKMCNIAVLSSHWEGFGLAAVEAMACGIPLIASNVEGLSQVVGNNGLLFEKGNEVDLVAQIKSLQNLELYNQKVYHGLQRAKDFDISIMVDKTIGIYESSL